MINHNDAFSGTWKMNPPQSSFDANHQPSQGTLRFEPQAVGYRMYAAGVCDGRHVEEQTQTFMLDNHEYPVPGAPGVVTISSRPNANTIHAIARNQGRTVGEATYTVSDDGLTLTAAVSGFDAQQRAFRTTVVWDRE